MGLFDRFRQDNPEPKPERVARGASGRAHTDGWLEFEEHNSELQHPHGHVVFDRMYRGDGDVKQVVGLAVNPALTGTWGVEPYGGEEADDEAVAQAKFVRWALWEQMSPNLLGFLGQLLPILVRSGLGVGEKTWQAVEYEGKLRLVPRTIGIRLPRTIERFRQDADGNLVAVMQRLPIGRDALVDGSAARGRDDTEVWIPRKDLVYFRLGAEGDNWEGVSLLRPVYKHWLFKDRIERIDAIAQEREAIGIPICYPPMSADDAQLDAVESVLEGMRTNEQAWIIAPGPKAGSGMAPEGQGWLFEVIGYDRTGSGRDPMPSLEYHTLKIAAAFIAEFMRLGHGQTGARATAQVQMDPFMASIEALTTVLEQELNAELVKPLIAYNFPDAKGLPKLQMSLVDSTSLAQLADFVQKLIQVGALMPDQELENFLRARADLPAADPALVKKRQAKDDELRREILVGGQPVAGEAHDKPGKQHGTKTAAGTNPGARGGPNRGAASEARDGQVGHTLSVDEAGFFRPHRSLRWHEMAMDLDHIARRVEAAPGEMVELCRPQVVALARELIDESTPLGDPVSGVDGLAGAIEGQLRLAYLDGREQVRREVDRMLGRDPDEAGGRVLRDAGARERQGDLATRARAAARLVLGEMGHHCLGHDLAHGNRGRAALAAERAGLRALRRAAHDHVFASMAHGRHDEGRFLADDDNGITIVGARYSAVMDGGTCSECEQADDGELRPLDDPVRLERQPPNPHCESTASGQNRCRCVEVFEPMVDAPALSLEDGALHPFVAEVARALVGGGMDPGRAVGVAEVVARQFCQTGRLLYPGLSHLGLTRAAACEASSSGS